MKKVVVIGGGTGQSALLRGLKQVENIELYAIVTVADDGGSTGRLRDDLHIPAMGDVRSVMLALAESESLMGDIMNYRFDNFSGALAGHNLGNIILSALTKKSGSFVQAIADVSKVLRVKGTVIPSTLNDVTLYARTVDGRVIQGEHNITDSHTVIDRVFYDQYVAVYPDALVAIREADYIIIGLGSVYTSILPNIIVEDIRRKLCEAKAKIIYYCNCMTQHGETDGYTVEKHVETLHKHLGKEIIDHVVYSTDDIPEEMLRKYEAEEAYPVVLGQKEHDYEVTGCSLLSFDTGVIRHDADKVRRSFEKIMEEDD
ncbi:MAG: YvcK family protein [Erysipelotrichaceae bacterium]|nr:YvcK family protein [Erysipelotrichaceae bacterium]